MVNLALYGVPDTLVVTVQEVKDEVKQAGSGDDALIGVLIPAATLAAEAYLRRSLITRNLTLHLDAKDLAGGLDLWLPPVISVASVTAYLQDDSASVMDLSNFVVDTAGGRLLLKTYSGAVWPSVLRPIDSVQVAYSAGFGEALADIPDTIREGIILTVADWYSQPDATANTPTIPPLAQRALHPYKNYAR